MSELNENDDLSLDMPGGSDKPTQAPDKHSKGPRKPLSKRAKFGLYLSGGLVGLLTIASMFGSPPGPTPEEVRQAELRRQAQEAMAAADEDPDDMMGDIAGKQPIPDNDFGLPRPTGGEPTRLDTVQRDKSDHITYRSDENLRDEYYRDGFNEVPTFEPPVNTVYVETKVEEPEYSHSESQCLRILERNGNTLSIAEHDYCLTLVQRRVARVAALRSLKYMDKPIEHWIELKRPNIEVGRGRSEVGLGGLGVDLGDGSQADQLKLLAGLVAMQTKEEKKDVKPKAPVIDYDSLYYLVDIIGDTAVLRGGNTGRVFEFKEGDKLAYNGVLEKIEGDTVHLRFGQKSVPLALWNQSSFER